MKKWIALLLITALLLPMAGCSGSTGTDVTFFYRRITDETNITDGIVASEIRSVSSMEEEDLFRAYFLGPEDSGLSAPFPRDSQVVRWEIRDQVLRLTMNSSFGALSGVELTIACVCAAKTFLGLLPVDQVLFQLEDGLLGGEKSLVFSEDNISLFDNSLVQSRADFLIYYTDSDRRYLIEEKISINLATENDPVAYLLEALLIPPEGSGLRSALPPGTRLLDYTIDNGICTVNLSREFELRGWTTFEAQRLSILSIVNTLTQTEDIQQVEFKCEGNLLVSYQRLSISGPFSFDEHCIGPVRTGMSEFDATLYLSNGSEDYLAPVPARIRQTAGISQAELVIQTLLDYPSGNSIHCTIPEGTLLRSVTIHNGVCQIDLSEQFLTGESHLTASVRSIVATVCTLEGIGSAKVTVEGRIPDEDHAHLFQVLTPSSDWFL